MCGWFGPGVAMPLGGRKNKGKKAPRVMQLDTTEDPCEQSYAVRRGGRGEEVVLGMGAGSKSKGDEVTINAEGITFRGHTKQLCEQDLEEFHPGGNNFLGQGAAGLVELMRIRATGEAVAVKHIAVDEKHDRDQTIQEVESMWRLNHPNIGTAQCQNQRAFELAKDPCACAWLTMVRGVREQCSSTVPIFARLITLSALSLSS